MRGDERPFADTPGPAMISGARAERSNSVCFIHCPRSPRW